MISLHTADWHLDRSNLEFTVPAIERAIQDAGEYDLFTLVGDLGIHRGSIHPDVAFHIRRLILMGNKKAKTGSIIVSGNHDLSFQRDAVGMVPGILAGEERGIGLGGYILIADRPRTFEVDGVRFVCIPTPDKFQVAAMMENSDEVDIDGLLTQMIQGMIADARTDFCGAVVVLYHGTVRGAKLSNEQIMKAGVDISVSSTAFAGCDVVMAGHIHQPQIVKGSPDIFYSGAPAPLTWNDKKLKPIMYKHEITTKGTVHGGRIFDHKCDEIPVHVLSQMIDVAKTYTEPIASPDAEIANIITASGAEPGDRLRIKLEGPAHVLDCFKQAAAESVGDIVKLRQVKLIKECTDSVSSKIDIEADFAVPDAFVSWCNLRGIDHQTVVMATSLVDLIEAEIVDQHLDAHYECRPISIEATNWCQYEHVRLEFSDFGKIVAIDGDDNYIGKSNLCRLFAFSRYRKQIVGDKLVDLIRHGEDKCKVTEVFESNGQTYRTIRTIKRTAAGGSKCDCHFQRQNGIDELMLEPAWEVVNEGTAGETQTAIDQLIGPYELFRSTIYAGQNDVAGLLDLKPAAMKDVALSVLQRNFEGRIEIARKRMSEQETERDRLKVKVEGADNAQEQLTEAQDTRRSLAERVEDLAGKQVAEADLEAAHERVATAKADHEKVAFHIRQRQAMANEMGKLVSKVEENENQVKAIEVNLSGIEGAKKELDVLITDEAYQAKKDEFNKLLDDILAADSAVQAVTAQANSVVVEARGIVTDSENKLSGLGSELTLALYNEAAAAKKIVLRDDVPCEGGKWMPAHGDESIDVDMSTCEFLADSIAAAAEKPALDQLVKDIGQRSFDQGLEVKEARRRLAELEADGKTAIEDTTARFQTLSDKRAPARAALDILKLQHERRLEIGVGIACVAGYMDSLELHHTNINESKARVEQITAELEGIQDRGDPVKAAEAVAGAEAELGAFKSLSKQMAVELSRAEKALAKIDGGIAKMLEIIEENQDLTDQMELIETNLAAWRVVEQAMHRDGIPFLLLEKFAIPALQAGTNRYLANTELRVSVESEKELTTGSVRNELVFTFEDHRGRHTLSAASGMQRTAIGMALRNALADLHAQATGSRIWMSIQDEGFGTMKPKHLDGAKATIAQIAEARGHFLFISHIAGMAEIADTMIEVVDNGGVSSVEVR